MDGGLAALLGALIGAISAIGGNLILEVYRQHRRTRTSAAIIYAELEAILAISASREYETFFESILPELDAGNYVYPGRVIIRDPTEDPAYERTIELLRDLPAVVAQDVVEFWGLYKGIQVDLYRFGLDEFRDNPKGMATTIRHDLTLWRQAKVIARSAIDNYLAKLSVDTICKKLCRHCRNTLFNSRT